MKGVVNRYATAGPYAPAEPVLEIMHRSRRNNGPAVLCSHGFGGNPTFASANGNDYSCSAILAHLAALNFRVVSVDAGGGTPWFNDASMAECSAAVDYYAPGGADICFWFGYSMGGGTGVNITARRQDKIKGLVLTNPTSDLIAAEQVGAFQPTIWSAYGGTHASFLVNVGPVGGDIGHDPITIAPLVTVPCRVLSAVDDAVVPNASVNTLFGALSSADKQMKNAAGGGHVSPWPYWDRDALGRWLLSLV